ncbi:Zn-dependent exopeptidase [Rhizopogon vinicolor AM-OR11-026]|uniref:Peptide hydrolase n=2 Tax=Rhizopogon vinicolor AM-OR11-026 TaxID=1314800 RepID=A0A1B7MFE7_9AGAM|nr:Zn-dependent exopeptidase [Rhizopogon vinicolor AM-OR11-026]
MLDSTRLQPDMVSFSPTVGIASAALLFITPYTQDISAIEIAPGCLTDNYFGTYGVQSVFHISTPCLENSSFQDFETATLIPYVADGDRQLVWLQESAIDSALVTPEYEVEVQHFVKWLEEDGYAMGGASGYQQILFTTPEPRVELQFIKVQPGVAFHGLVAVDPSLVPSLEALLPRYWKTYILPEQPMSYLPVPKRAIEHVKSLLETARFDPVVSSIVNSISLDQMRANIRWLTGEDGESGIVSRHSSSEGSRVAANWLKERFEEAGATCELKPFKMDFAPNVVCKYSASVDKTSTVLISGHYDSRGSSGSQRAPGGNDDGSGTIAILGIAHVIASTGIKFRSNVELIAFAGEEQGLYGSRAYAREMREKDANITVMIQADMLGYHAPGEPPQLGLPMFIGTPEVAQLVSKISAIYSPELSVGSTIVCCSDHQSFLVQGFPATQLFERAGLVADPMYHNSGDLSERPGYDLNQIRSIAKVQFATLLHAAGFDLPSENTAPSMNSGSLPRFMP